MGGGRQRPVRRRGLLANLPGAAVAVSMAIAGLPGNAEAGEGYALLGAGGGMGGVLDGGFGGDGLDGYAGVIYAPGHMLSDGGMLLRGWAKAYRSSYDADHARIDAFGYGVQVEAGWQFAGPRGRIALIPGVAWRDYSLDPPDPGSSLGKDRFGLSLTADAEWRFGERFGIMANGSYLTGFQDYWVQSRPFVHLGGGWKMGLDFAGWGGPGYDRMRAGIFTSGYELPVKSFGRLFLGAVAGAQSDMDGSDVAPFAGVNIGLLF